MPYTIKKKDGKFVVKKKSTGKVVGTTDSAAKLRGMMWHREHGK